MELILNKKKINMPVERLLKEAGYNYIYDRKTEKESFVRPMASSGYPRFHIYVKAQPDRIILNMHLDQKKPSYQGARAHSGEYEGETVEAEIERLKGEIRRIILNSSADQSKRI